LCLSCSSRRIARELGVHSRTSYRWCWWLRNSAVSYNWLRVLQLALTFCSLCSNALPQGTLPFLS
jgi:hypothetical protein